MTIRGDFVLRGGLAGLILAVAGAAFSQTVGNYVPTADVVPHLSIDSYYEIDGGSRVVDHRYSTYKLATFGLFDRAEVGVTMDHAEEATWNAKALLVEDQKWGKFAVGFLGYQRSYHEPYAVYQYDFADRWYAAVGGIRRGEVDQGMAVLSIPLPYDVTFVADHYTGRSGITGLGLWIPVYKDMLTFGTAFAIPNDWRSDQRPTHYFTLEYGFGFGSGW
jgi:hypothetical protein